MNLTAKLKPINYVFKRQQNCAPSQGGVTETLPSCLKQQQQREREN